MRRAMALALALSLQAASWAAQGDCAAERRWLLAEGANGGEPAGQQLRSNCRRARQGAQEPAYSTYGDETLAALVAEALEHNPAIRSAEWQEVAAREGIGAVTALPDPSLQLTGFPRGPQTRVGPQIAGVAVTQRVPWFGKLADEGSAAAQHAQVRRALANVVRANVVQQVKLAYFEAAYLAQATQIATEEEELLRHYESLARAQYAQGMGLQRDVVRIQAEITRVRGRIQEFEGKRFGALASLNALRQRPTDSNLPRIEFGPRPSARIDADALRTLARSFAPEVKVAQAQVAQRAANARIAERRHLPDVVFGAGWGIVGDRNDASGKSSPPPGNGEDTFHVSAGITIPIRRAKYDAGIKQADAALAAAKDAHRSALADVDAAVQSIASRLIALDERLALAEHTLLPQAEHALSSTEDAYATGAVGVLDLLDGEEVLLGVRLNLARLHTDYMKALAEMERAVGEPFPVQGQGMTRSARLRDESSSSPSHAPTGALLGPQGRNGLRALPHTRLAARARARCPRPQGPLLRLCVRAGAGSSEELSHAKEGSV